MQLLDKKSIAIQKSFERKKEIDEGAKLAQTIDKLRQTRGKEEKEFFQFREFSLGKLKQDIKELDDKKSSLLSIVEDLEERKRSALEPLTEEHTKIQKNREALKKSQEDLSLKISSFLENERLQELRRQELLLEEERLEEKRKDANILIEHAINTSSEAQSVLVSATQSADSIMEKAKLREEEILGREMQVSLNERDIMNHKRLLEKKEDFLNKKERAINDKYNTLLRTQARLKNK